MYFVAHLFHRKNDEYILCWVSLWPLKDYAKKTEKGTKQKQSAANEEVKSKNGKQQPQHIKLKFKKKKKANSKNQIVTSEQKCSLLLAV